MDHQEQERKQQLMKQYLQGAEDAESMARFDAWYREFKQDPSLDLSQEDVQQAMQRMNARLKAATSKGRVVGISHRIAWRISGAAAAVLLMLVLSTAFKPGSFLFNAIHPEQESVVSTWKGASKVIAMPDGSRIHLNENSSLTYTNRYAQGATRTITLKGEAFFEVTKDPQHPFIVKAGKAAITVLGTSFNVSVSKNDAGVVVAVRDGLISLQQNENASGKLLVAANQAGVLAENSDSPVFCANANVGNYLSWMDGKLNFDSTPLKDVVVELQNIYHVPIRLENTALSKIRLTLQYKHATLPVVLDVICNSLDLQHTDVNGTIVLKAMP